MNKIISKIKEIILVFIVVFHHRYEGLEKKDDDENKYTGNGRDE